MKIVAVERGSIAEELGLLPGDDLLEMSGHRIHDGLDYRFYEPAPEVTLKVARGSDVTEYEIEKDDGEPLGIELEEMKILSCGNDCVFCFVDQNPKGLRQQLYFRDGDYRLSFMYGNYTTMTNAGPAILRRIITQRLSPQYISVHATDLPTRMRLMGLKKDDFILEKIALLHDNGIDMHTQIVLCPGLNDGEVLTKTVEDLYRFRSRVVSLSVVPVGLTDHRFGLTDIRKIDREYARDIVGRVRAWQKRFRAEIGRNFVYASDEFFLLAGEPIPPAGHYDGYPQIENGVGMVRQFLSSVAKQARRFPTRLPRPRRLTLVTGELAHNFMRERVVAALGSVRNLSIDLVVAENTLFGRNVTVSGLLSGNCVYSAVGKKGAADLILLPPDILNTDSVFLDDMSVPELESQLGVPVMVYAGSWARVFARLRNVERA